MTYTRFCFLWKSEKYVLAFPRLWILMFTSVCVPVWIFSQLTTNSAGSPHRNFREILIVTAPTQLKYNINFKFNFGLTWKWLCTPPNHPTTPLSTETLWQKYELLVIFPGNKSHSLPLFSLTCHLISWQTLQWFQISCKTCILTKISWERRFQDSVPCFSYSSIKKRFNQKFINIIRGYTHFSPKIWAPSTAFNTTFMSHRSYKKKICL